VAAELPGDQSIVTVLFDSAWKYVSVWDGDYSGSAQVQGEPAGHIKGRT
jgi:hypothetical protein